MWGCKKMVPVSSHWFEFGLASVHCTFSHFVVFLGYEVGISPYYVECARLISSPKLMLDCDIGLDTRQALQLLMTRLYLRVNSLSIPLYHWVVVKKWLEISPLLQERCAAGYAATWVVLLVILNNFLKPVEIQYVVACIGCLWRQF